LLAPEDRWLWLNHAYDINNHGQVVGSGYVTDTSGVHAYRMNLNFVDGVPVSAAIEDLGQLVAGEGTYAVAINDHGDVAGRAWDETMRVVFWKAAPDGSLSSIQDLGTFDGTDGMQTWAESMNDDGQIAGWTGSEIAWRYTPGVGFENLGTLASNGAGGAAAYDINNLGDVVGEAATSRRGDEWRAFMDVEASGMLNLGTFSPKKDPNDSVARALNDSGYVIGSSGTGNSAAPYAVFLYHSSFGMVNLESLVEGGVPDYLKGDKLRPARINASGQICGPRVREAGEPPGQAYLLTPVP
jgi:probable HAF family extracellular repeat protein